LSVIYLLNNILQYESSDTTCDEESYIAGNIKSKIEFKWL